MTGAAEDARLLRQLRVADFLSREAKLLDEWRLEEWLALFTDDARYVVPGTDDPQADPSRSLVLVDDDRERLGWRVKRLLSGHAHREFPWSRTRRIVSNVLVEDSPPGRIFAGASFVVWRFRHRHADPFIGHADYDLVDDGAGLRIAAKRITIDQESLSPNGALSMIL
ncbi:MAG: aromatic-ring-hydroxylating dioxygenase subunit beta [Deltaproteobacteria bacterium]|nr:aromatic-ring-hydroxylating dioxygenase subunit beta [Deltaproteobacteria bacterium]